MALVEKKVEDYQIQCKVPEREATFETLEVAGKMGTTSEEGESAFVRGSSWRTTRRFKNSGPPVKPPRPPLQLKIQERPPLPPPRNPDDCKHERSSSLRSTIERGNVPPPLPPYPHLNKSLSFNDESRIRRTREISGIPTTTRTSTFFVQTPELTKTSPILEKSDSQTQERKNIPLPHRRANSLIQTHSPSSPGTDTKKNVFSFFKNRRATSSSPKRGGSLRGDEFRVMEGNEMIPQVNAQSRSSSPSPHTPGLASPTTYRRARHPSDNSIPPPSNFRRADSMPHQRVFSKRKVSTDVATTINRLMSQSMRLPHTSKSAHRDDQYTRAGINAQGRDRNRDYNGDRENSSPWGDRAFMQWPLRPYQERQVSPLQPPSTFAPTIPPSTYAPTIPPSTYAPTIPPSTYAPSTYSTSTPASHPSSTHHLLSSICHPPSRIPTQIPTSQSTYVHSYPHTSSINPHSSINLHCIHSPTPERSLHIHTPPDSEQYEDSDCEFTGSKVCLLPRTSPENSQAARPRLKLKGYHENTGFLDYPNATPSNTPNSSISSSNSSSSPSSPTVAYTIKTYVRPAPPPPENRDGEENTGSHVGHSDIIGSKNQGPNPRKPLVTRNSLPTIAVSRSESPITVSRTYSLISTDSGVGSMFGLGSTVDLVESLPPTDNFSYLISNDREYLDSLFNLLSDYGVMSKTTPPSIRQHFDLVFQQLELITHFQEMLHENLKSTAGNVSCLAKVLRDDQFQCYSSYMVLTPAVQRDFHRHSAYFQEHFTDLLRNILKPSFRLNFYAMILESFKKDCTETERKEVGRTVDYLNKLKRLANTEMTLTAVMESPVDLRLGGDLLHIDDLYCQSAVSLQKKKYTLILFENLLVITSCKQAFYKYKLHYRVEQLEKVKAVGQNELLIYVLMQGNSQQTTLRFRARTHSTRDNWVERLQKIAEENQQARKRRQKPESGTGFGVHSRLLPLSLSQVYTSLSNTLEHKTTEKPMEISTGDCRHQLIQEERKYLTNLSKLLNPETLLPHPGLSQLLESLYELHSKVILPTLQSSRSVSEILKWFMMNANLFNIYTEYLVIRSQATLQINTPTATHYISPVQHFTFYLAWLQQLACSQAHSSAAISVIQKFRDFTKQAQRQLVTHAVIGGRIDFQRSGDFVRYDKMDIKTRQKEVRGGNYFALLFQNVIILTKPKAPYYEYSWDIWLDQVNLGPPVSMDSVFKLEVRQGGGKEPVTYEFSAENPKVKQDWLNCLHQQMLQQADKIRKRTSIHSQPLFPQQGWEND